MGFGIPFGAPPTIPEGMNPDDIALVLQALRARQGGADGLDAANPAMPLPPPPQGPQSQAGPLLAGTMGLPQQMPLPSQDAPAPGPAQLPSLAGVAPPAMPPMMPPSGGVDRPEGVSPSARRVTSLAPVAPSGSEEADDPSVNLPMTRVPLPPARPPEFGASATAGPSETGAITTGTPALTGPTNSVSKPNGPPVGPQAASDGPSGLDAWQALAKTGIGDTLLAMSAGFLSGRGAAGWSQAMQGAQRASAQNSANQLAQAEYGLKTQKARQEQIALTANAQFVKSKLAAQGQNISDDQAIAFASNGSFMSELLKGSLPPTEQYTTVTDDKGNQFSKNTRTGQSSLLLKADEDKTQTPLLDPAARAAAGIGPDDPRRAWIDANKKVTFDSGPEQTADIRNWQEARRQGYDGSLVDYQNQRALAGRNQTTINMPPTEQARDKKIGDAIGTDISDYIAASRPAREKLAALNVLADAWKAGGDKITTGPAAERVLGLKQFARGSLGLNIGDDIAPSELISKIGTQLATADAKSLTARPTQFDFATYLKNNPGLNLTPEGNAALIDIKRQQAQHELDLAALARKKENWDNWDDVVAQFDRTHPIVSSLTGKPLDANSVQFPGPASRQSTPVTGAAIPGGAVQALQQNPGLAAQFEAKYGPGSASRYLGGR